MAQLVRKHEERSKSRDASRLRFVGAARQRGAKRLDIPEHHFAEPATDELIDGLDEVPDIPTRKRLRDDVVFPLLDRIQASYAVATSRIVGYDEVPYHSTSGDVNQLDPIGKKVSDMMPQGRRIQGIGSSPISTLSRWFIAPLSPDDIREFVARWYAVRDPGERAKHAASLCHR